MFDGLDTDVIDGLLTLKKDEEQRLREARPEYPHADCAICIFWNGRCTENHGPSGLGPYQKCWWCRTPDKPKTVKRQAQTQKLF